MEKSNSIGVGPFLFGSAVGAAAGLAFGALLSGQIAQLIAAIVHAADRRGIERDRDRLRFDLLLQ